jgi:ferric-dicitrate binding protein FerR (iron transport regulator)
MLNGKKKYFNRLLENDDFVGWLVEPTKQSNDYWHHLMKTDKQQEKYINQIQQWMSALKVKEQNMSPETKSLLWAKIEQNTISRRKFRIKRFRYGVVAAAASLLILVISYTWLHLNRKEVAIDYTALMENMKDEEPENIRLVLSEEKMLDIEENNRKLVYDEEGKVNIPTETESKTETGGSLNQLIVPYGKMSSVVLSDGSIIWINSGSRIIYPAVFTGNKREIFVEGEIYLEVTENREKPFIVKTSALEINVLGTSFNVQAYKGENEQDVVLATGAVSIKNNDTKEKFHLEPNQIYDYKSDKRLSNIEKVDIYDYICWKYGFLHFRSKELSTVLERLRKYYNVNIEYNRKDVESVLVSGKLDLKENLHDVLDLIALTAKVRFENRENKIVVIVEQ